MDTQSLQKINENFFTKELFENIKSNFVDINDALAVRNAIKSVLIDNPKLLACTAESILTAAYQAIHMNLSISPKLGYVYFIPYKKQAQLQIGYKGMLQLAIRSGFYKHINSDIVFEGMIKAHDFITGEYILVEADRKSDKVEGYIAYFELVNGFRKMLFMTADQMHWHAQKFSAAYQYDLQNNERKSLWSTDFDSMAKKTVLNLLLKSYGILSVDMEKVLTADFKEQ